MMSDIRVGRGVQDSPQNLMLYRCTRYVIRLQKINPTKATGDMKNAAQTVAERHFRMLQVHFCLLFLVCIFFSIWAVQHK